MEIELTYSELQVKLEELSEEATKLQSFVDEFEGKFNEMQETLQQIQYITDDLEINGVTDLTSNGQAFNLILKEYDVRDYISDINELVMNATVDVDVAVELSDDPSSNVWID